MGTPDNRGSGRLPIATGALVIVLLGAFWLSNQMIGEARVDFDARLAEAAGYLMENPYLDVHPRLEAFAGADEIDRRRRAFWMARERRGAPAISNALRSRYQQTLDEKVERAFATLDGLPDRVWGLNPNRPSGPSFFTYAFVHSGFLHLATNVLAFCWLGVLLEAAWGSAMLLGFALCATALSGGVFVWANPELDASLIGFSGVVAACLGAYAVNAGNAARGARYLVTLTGAGALLILPALLGREWSLAPVSTGDEFGPSQWAVLGGMVFGALSTPVIWFVKLDAGSAIQGLSKRDLAASQLVERARRAAARGQSAEAADLLRKLAQRPPTDRAVALGAWQVASAVGLQKDATGMMLCVIRAELRAGEREAAARHWLELQEVEGDVRAEPRLLVRLAPLLQDLGRAESAVRVLERALQVVDPAAAPEIASSVALAARVLAPELARRAARQALGFDLLDSESRTSLELLVARLPATGRQEAPEPLLPRDSSGRDSDAFPDRVETARALEHSPESPPSTGSPEEARQDEEMWELPELSDLSDEIRDDAAVDRAAAATGAPLRAAEPSNDAAHGDFALELSSDVEELTDILAPGARETAEAAPSGAAQPSPTRVPGERELDIVTAVPVRITPSCLEVEIAGQGKRSLDLDAIDALAAGVVGGLAPTPVVVIDLIFNWTAGESEPLRITRLRSDTFDARQIMSVNRSVDDALRELLGHLLAVANPTTLPDPMSVAGLPFAVFANADEYARVVLYSQGDEELELL